ncbi:hypothetical protein Pelo_6265 [Pelomyxa schiedti]|nr:hypothetical protein Pelo_6265 [Pelomyxa schiedti]
MSDTQARGLITTERLVPPHFCENFHFNHLTNQWIPNKRPRPDCILDGLYIGDLDNAFDSETLESLGITHVLSVLEIKDIPDFYSHFPKNIIVETIQIPDDTTVDISQYFPKAIEFISKALRETGENGSLHNHSSTSSASSFPPYIPATPRASSNLRKSTSISVGHIGTTTSTGICGILSASTNINTSTTSTPTATTTSSTPINSITCTCTSTSSSSSSSPLSSPSSTAPPSPSHNCENSRHSDRRGGVLVHCAWGVSRSAAVVTAFVMYALSMDWASALRAVQSEHPTAFPSLAFARQLADFGSRLAATRASQMQLRTELWGGGGGGGGGEGTCGNEKEGDQGLMGGARGSAVRLRGASGSSSPLASTNKPKAG